MCPIRAGGSVAIAGEYGTGNTVNMEELVRRISGGSDPVTLFLFFPPPSEIWPPSLDENYSISAALKEEGYSEGTVGCVQTFFVGGEAVPRTAEKVAALAPIDTVIQLSRKMILAKNYPGVDVLTARSRLLDENLIDAEPNRPQTPAPTLCCWNARENCRRFSRSLITLRNRSPNGRARTSAAPMPCAAAAKSSTDGSTICPSRHSILREALMKSA